MERIIHFEQFYYTNYGQGMRFEGNSTGQTAVASALELLASNWMKQDLLTPVEMVFYHRRLETYIAAMSVPCTEIGDSRTSYWIHAIMPAEYESDGFMECLSWPLQDYQTEVQLGQTLNPMVVAVPPIDLVAICQKYHLTGKRLQKLMYSVLKTVCDASAPSCLCLTVGEDVIDANATAREIMAVIYHLLPKSYRKEVDYLANSDSDREDVRFYFKKNTAKRWHFSVTDANERNAEPALAEEEARFLSQMADWFEQSPVKYAQMLEKICTSTADDYETMIWNYYKCCLQDGNELPFSQETLVRIQPFLEEKLKQDESYRCLFCQCLNQIAIEHQPMFFIQSLMEQSMVATAGLPDKSSSVYTQSLSNNWQRMECLRKGETKVVTSYLQWIKDISFSYYQDFVQCGLLEGRDWLLDLQFEHGDALTYQELMRMDLTWMNIHRGRLWVDAMAGCLKRHQELQHSQKTAKEVWQYLIELLGELAAKAIAEADIFETPEAAEQIAYLLTFIWQNRTGFGIADRAEICGAAKAYCSHIFDAFSQTFWQEVLAEDLAVLYEIRGIARLFEGSLNLNYQNYRYYVGYRHKEERENKVTLKNKEKEALQAYKYQAGEATALLAEAIWLFWTTHSSAKDAIFFEYMQVFMSENEMSERLNQYSAEGLQQSERVERIRKMMMPSQKVFDARKEEPQEEKEAEQKVESGYKPHLHLDALSAAVGFLAGFLSALLLVWLIHMIS